MLTFPHIIGILLTISLLLLVSILSAHNVKDAKSYTTGGTSGSWMVCGAIMGTLVGGQSTIGTAQLAFCFGISAWWFTIGAAVGALVLALFYAGPLRRSGCSTLTEIIAHEYGRKAETLGSILCLLGIFISIVAQVLASSAMMTTLFHIPELWAAILSALLIMSFVFFGGIKSASTGGIIKMILLYLCSIVAGFLVWHKSDGISNLFATLHATFDNPVLSQFNQLESGDAVSHRFGSLFARGPLKDLGSCLSLVLGVVSTQTYAQGIWSGRTTRKAQRGALFCTILIPVIGAACTLVGLYMRAHYITAAELEALNSAGLSLPEGMGILQHSAQTFPTFILDLMPDWIGGIVLGTLFVTILGGGSGLSLGAATILVRDVYTNLGAHRNGTGIYRITLVAILVMAVVVALSFNGSFINDLGFLSLGLRATALLFPLSFALFLPGRFKASYIRASMLIATATMLAAKLCGWPADPVYWGLGAGAVVSLMGLRCKHLA